MREQESEGARRNVGMVKILCDSLCQGDGEGGVMTQVMARLMLLCKSC